MKNPSVKLTDVAKLAGMSPATASRALRGMKVHKKHQGKAEAAAAELGYVLNEAARALRSEKTMTVGMVYFELTSLLGMELLGSIAGRLEEFGYSVFVSTAMGKPELYDKLVQKFLQRRVDALVCIHGDGEAPALQGFAAAGIPVIALISKAGGYGDLPMVNPSIVEASAECVRRLKALGHKVVDVVIPPTRRILPLHDFIVAAEAEGLPVRRHESGPGFDPKAFLQTLRGQDRMPTVLVSLQADTVRLATAAEGLSIPIPSALSLVAIRDRTVLPPGLTLALSTIHFNPTPMGAEAADVLKAWLVDGQPLARDRGVEIGSWIERDTTGPAV